MEGQAVALGAADHADEANCKEAWEARETWEEWDPEGMLVRFVLQKERYDTLGAVAVLAEELGVPERAFSYAGLKDYHAVTTQEIVVCGVHPSLLCAIRLERLTLGRIRIVERKLRLGECGGNRFRIRLRRVQRGPAAASAAFASLSETGFINYYGLQRFGSHASRNDEVGRALLLGDYPAVVDALLAHADGQKLVAAEADARAAWIRSGDASTALRLMPKQRTLASRLPLKCAPAWAGVLRAARPGLLV